MLPQDAVLVASGLGRKKVIDQVASSRAVAMGPMALFIIFIPTTGSHRNGAPCSGGRGINYGSSSDAVGVVGASVVSATTYCQVLLVRRLAKTHVMAL